jgi:hypothetical protein
MSKFTHWWKKTINVFKDIIEDTAQGIDDICQSTSDALIKVTDDIGRLLLPKSDRKDD